MCGGIAVCVLSLAGETVTVVLQDAVAMGEVVSAGEGPDVEQAATRRTPAATPQRPMERCRHVTGLVGGLLANVPGPREEGSLLTVGHSMR
jgi:hypothetical protein